ncbi:TetR/AcrR family transcriptional regulator [Protaetiibacter intestinalis]|uniref:TetR/AcrR family transcriptional regulator n=1 Tax=Protaetiibacter intestinalis TaxID=2419774 RepID=A0A387B6T7_9MICO|nr:TetR family transcriptional regulator [Protaetiibacter intestinalis]AYF98057.1 TetR/AcrR family transcriptional regulator [Protaetiibacter intestinalis]
MTTPRVPAKESIRAAAAKLFPVKGYTGTSVRDIAAEAGVDPALVIRHYGSKEGLFLEIMRVDESAPPLLDGPLETLGERFIDYVLTPDDEVRGVFLALLRASESEGVAPRLRLMHETAFVAPLLSRLEGPDAELRARLAAALVGGLLYSLWVVGDEQLLAADHADLVRRYGALLQSLITP